MELHCVNGTRFIIHSLLRDIGVLYFLTVVKSAATKMNGQVSLKENESCGCVPRGGIAESYGRFTFGFLRVFHITLDIDCTSLHSNQQ